MYQIGIEEINSVAEAINSDSIFKINDGFQFSKKVEEELCAKTNADYSILMTSGHAALESALVAAGIGPGDEVIVPAYTYISTAMAVVGAGAIPVICEIDETLTLDPDDFEAKITPNTKAVMPVHIQGFPCNMDKICDIAKKHGIYVIEDACQADGGSYKGKRLASIGDAGAFSFNYFKIITSGEGGALITSNRKIFENSLIYHDSSAVAFFGNQLENFGAEPFCGTEYRTNDINAAILFEQLKKLDNILSKLRGHKKKLMEAIGEKVVFAPSNDIEGDCGTTVAIQFDTEAKTRAFAEKIGGWIPYDTGKHVYKNWTPIMNKRGALNPLMDPFKFEANKDIVPDYKEDMCQKSLDILARTAYVGIDYNWNDEAILARAAEIVKAIEE